MNLQDKESGISDLAITISSGYYSLTCILAFYRHLQMWDKLLRVAVTTELDNVALTWELEIGV